MKTQNFNPCAICKSFLLALLAVLTISTQALAFGDLGANFAAPGDLNPTFGTGGRAVTNVRDRDLVTTVAVQRTAKSSSA